MTSVSTVNRQEEGGPDYCNGMRIESIVKTCRCSKDTICSRTNQKFVIHTILFAVMIGLEGQDIRLQKSALAGDSSDGVTG